MGHQYHDLQYWCMLGGELEKNDIDGCVGFMVKNEIFIYNSYKNTSDYY